jgi:hypothetical protein
MVSATREMDSSTSYSEVLTTVNIRKGLSEENLPKVDAVLVSGAIETAADLRRVLSEDMMGDNDRFLNREGFPLNRRYESQMKWTDLAVGKFNGVQGIKLIHILVRLSASYSNQIRL